MSRPRRERVSRRKVFGLTILLLVLLTAAALLLRPRGTCPVEGAAVSTSGRELARLKNREAEPAPSDFDGSATLEALLGPGEDRARWSESRAARVEGYVVEVVAGGVEAA